MKILLHTCCAPCSIYPVQFLREQNMEVMGYFYKSNIHPYQECEKRLQALTSYAADIHLKLIIEEAYNLEAFLQEAVFRESERCRICYHTRLKTTALLARRGKFDCFSTTLLYSKFQNHSQIKSIGEHIGQITGVPFYYHDFREGWKFGIEESKRVGMYRQSYCGCIYSEKERFYRSTGKRKMP